MKKQRSTEPQISTPHPLHLGFYLEASTIAGNLGKTARTPGPHQQEAIELLVDLGAYVCREISALHENASTKEPAESDASSRQSYPVALEATPGGNVTTDWAQRLVLNPQAMRSGKATDRDMEALRHWMNEFGRVAILSSKDGFNAVEADEVENFSRLFSLHGSNPTGYVTLFRKLFVAWMKRHHAAEVEDPNRPLGRLTAKHLSSRPHIRGIWAAFRQLVHGPSELLKAK